MEKMIIGTVSIGVGCLLITVLRRPLAQRIVRGLNHALGVFGRHVGERRVKSTEVDIVIGGIMTIIWGLVYMFY